MGLWLTVVLDDYELNMLVLSIEGVFFEHMYININPNITVIFTALPELYPPLKSAEYSVDLL